MLKLKMTPPLQWVFLLALVGSAVGIPMPRSDDACVLLCHPAARSSPEGVCERWSVQSGSVLDQARIIATYCLDLCDHDAPTYSSGISCRILTSILVNRRGCHCSSTDAVPNAGILPLVSELAEDIVSVTVSSPLGGHVICALGTALSLETGVVAADGTGLDAACHRHEPLAQDSEEEDLEEDRSSEERSPIHRNDKDILNGDEMSTAASKDSSEEGKVDWELWCVKQCNKGHGGNACRCDLLP